MPDTGILQVVFQMVQHPMARLHVEYSLKMTEKKDADVAVKLRSKVCELMHDEFALNPKSQRPVSYP